MQLRYNYRLYPEAGQRRSLAQAFGCARVVFNDGLHARQEARKAGLPYITDAELSARLTAAKLTPEREWLGEVSSVVQVANPRFLRRAERKLRKAQRDLSRKQKGSANRAKARVKVARVHARVADSRRDWLHKESTRIVRENQAVYVEDLCVRGLARTRLAKSVHDARGPSSPGC